MERKDIGVVVTGGKQKTDKPSTGETIIKDEDSKTEIKDIDLDETQLSELDQPGVDVDL
ncbi:MAG: hypothetical protein LBO09_00840 [Candidatus Peribacteria bacterium]|jgi:hypothetical protein|nr:hypothetical protein [Candidatus Peribacteria bacterium]